MKPQLHVFSTKPSSSSSTLISSMKIKTLIHTLVISQVCRVIRALSKAKSVLVQILKENQPIHALINPKRSSKHSRQTKFLFGSFRLHYNWCSSHVLPVPTPHLYCDSTWNSIISGDNLNNESQLAGYLQWLEEKVKEDENHNNNNNKGDEEEGINEIDQLADMFIANFHEKFRLEKQESYRRFQEMMARSM